MATLFFITKTRNSGHLFFVFSLFLAFVINFSCFVVPDCPGEVIIEHTANRVTKTDLLNISKALVKQIVTLV